MVGYILLALLGAWFLFSVISPTWRRIWVFQLYAWKAVFLWLFGLLHLAPRYSRPELLRLFCEDLGPTFIKFGQIVASSAGMFPKRYIAEFQKCLDRVRPFEFAAVQKILADELGADAGRLTELDPKPLASASIAQVHTARLDGQDVVVKVQRPGIQSRVDADMRIMRAVARLAEMWVRDAELANPVGIVEDFAATLREELDFRKEADNLELFNQIMVKLEHKDVRAPKPVRELTTVRVLVMERFYGTRVDDVEKMKARGVDAENKLITGMKAWFQCVLFHGFFHGDVHAGNLMLLDNEDIGFLDFGIVGRFSDQQRAMVTDYVVAFALGDYKGLAKIIVNMGGVHEKIDIDGFSSDLEQAYSPLLKKSFGEINYGEMLPQIQRVASKHRMKLPKEFVLITKQMLYFDRYAKLLAPSLNVFTDPRLVASMMMDIQKAKMQQMMAAAAKSS
jgi:predicted unusual protein kinase regulating ubiquinone biosynthesis (AarF/ABC1/UbiB family)